MTETTTSPGGDSESRVSTRKTTRRGGGDPATRGRTTIADGVVEKIAGTAAREVMGVHAMGSGLARTFGAMRDRVPGGTKAVARGVKAEVGEVQTALDLEIVVEYGYAIGDVAAAVRENVIAAVERMTSLEVVEVNIAVSDVKLPDEEDEEEPAQPRIQ
ncbi:Asp23/Gls24 family envelope stress response protein [Streptomyces sp. SID4985]|uniref:Asp23/Gls24 family envelope stress response protein n=1 Tax=Streptomyces sp. SID4985 TaxID=2690292 RepID=UPI00136D760C|nr:Asp23/Gls24 family envelope stress response protein [Streptomyces sp. SID4985]MYQ43775.1 Asp23/Gls24 family envelope stress response protein [Streptomyces sp. SID4985]